MAAKNTTKKLKDNNQVLKAMLTRAAIASKLGQSYEGERNLYEALGYSLSLSFDDYMSRYTRQDVASRIINSTSDSCWSQYPIIESENETFINEYESLVNNNNIYYYLNNADKLSIIGRYGALLIGLNDDADLKDPVDVNSKHELLYLRPFSEGNIKIEKWDDDSTTAHFGLPSEYKLTGSNQSEHTQVTVHHSRIIHIAENMLEGRVYGTPKLECVYNRLQDLELVAGSSSEIWWRCAFPGMNFAIPGDVDVDSMNTTAFENEIQDYVHGLKRYMKLQGVEVQQLKSDVASPKDHIDILIQLISAGTGIPKRILTGSERGELASSQDESNWLNKVKDRQVNHIIPMIIRPFIDRLISLNVLPDPIGYTVKFPSLFEKSEKDITEVAKTKAEILNLYASGFSDTIISKEIFLKKFLNMTDIEIEEIMATDAQAIKEDKEQ